VIDQGSASNEVQSSLSPLLFVAFTYYYAIKSGYHNNLVLKGDMVRVTQRTNFLLQPSNMVTEVPRYSFL